MYNAIKANMSIGGAKHSKASDSNYLFKPKWTLGETAAIRIPAILKDKLLGVARYLDIKSKKEIENLDIVEQLKNSTKLNNQTFKLHNETVKLNREIDMLTHINADLRKQLEKISKQSRYKIAVECFDEFLKSKNLNVEDLSKSRKNTKNYQLFEINQWLKNQDINNA